MVLFDTHCHINDERFDADRDETIQRMREAGVKRAIVVGDGAHDPYCAFQLAWDHEFLYSAAGVHPHDAASWTDEHNQKISEWMNLPKVVALGEIGLDYHYDLSPRDVQKEVFIKQLELAYQLNKPVILHIREAHGDATEILTDFASRGHMPRGIMHCYTGSWESAKTYLSLGLYISFSGAITFKNAPKLTEVARNMPLDRLLVETDCPYMAPVPMRGQRNEPAFVRYTLDKVAEIRSLNADELAIQTYNNANRIFAIPNA